MKNKILIHICLLTMILVTSSCTPTKIEEDPLTILAIKTCEPPCWQGIIPGVTTFDEAKFLIQNIIYFPKRPDILTPSNIYNDGVTRADVSFREPHIEVNIYADQLDIVDRIVFRFASDNRPELGDCTDLFGEPQFIGMSIAGKDFYSQIYFQFAYSQTILRFNKSMAFRFNPVKIPYSSSTRIDYIVYNSEQVMPTDYDYYFPWNEKGILQFEKNY